MTLDNAAIRRTVTLLTEQATDQIDHGRDAFTVACAISPEKIDGLDDTRTDWHHQYDLAAHIRTMVFRHLWEWKWTDTHEFLKEDDHAQTIGYDSSKFPDDNNAPSYSAINRAWNTYFDEELKQIVTETVHHIRDYAREIGNQTLTAEDKEDVSTRTEYRVKREKGEKAADQFRHQIYPEIDLPIPDDARFKEKDILDQFLHLALTGDFANNGAKTRKNEVEDETAVPGGDTFRDRIRELDELNEDEVSTMFDAASERLWQRADRRGYLNEFVDVAIDEHVWRYYGKDDTPRISDDVDPDRGTDKGYAFLTLSVIGDKGEKFALDVRQVASKQEKLEAVKDLVETADKRLFLREAVLDRGFYGTLFAQTLMETGVNFVIRAQRGYASKRLWDETEDGVNIEQATMSRSNAPYESVEITRFVVPAREKVDYEYLAFITNRSVTRREVKRIAETYQRRWGIETSFRVIGDFLPKTTSKDFALRQFYYQMAALLYNMWVLVNTVVAESLGYPPDASPPLTAKLWIVILKKRPSERRLS